jgi:hypothetical protein
VGCTLRPRALRCFLGALALAVLPAVDPLSAQGSGGVDLSGRAIDPLDMAGGTRATVLVFTRTDCPIANRLLPTVERLRAAYEPKSVRFWLVFVDPSEPPAAIQQHLTAFGQHSTAIRDPRHVLVKMTGATRTPEAAVFVQEGPKRRLVYRGRIDNRYVDVGRARPTPSSHDLQDALDAALAGGISGPPRITQPVGCIIADLE